MADNGDAVYAMYNAQATSHFNVFGNERMNVVATDGGQFSVFAGDRAFTMLTTSSAAAAGGPRTPTVSGGLGAAVSYMRVRSVGLRGGPCGTIDAVLPSPFSLAPANATATVSGGGGGRFFTLGGARMRTSWQSFGIPLSLERRVSAPPGNLSFLIDEIVISHLGGTGGDAGGGECALAVTHYEVADVKARQLVTQIVRSGVATPAGNALRDSINGYFWQQAFSGDYDGNPTVVANMSLKSGADLSAARSHHCTAATAAQDAQVSHACKLTFAGADAGSSPACRQARGALATAAACNSADVPAEGEASATDFYPADVFLASLQLNASSSRAAPGVAGAFVDGREFFEGTGVVDGVSTANTSCVARPEAIARDATAACPAAVLAGMTGHASPTLPQTDGAAQAAALVLVTPEFVLQPQQAAQLAFAHGWVPRGEDVSAATASAQQVVDGARALAPVDAPFPVAVATAQHWLGRAISVTLPNATNASLPVGAAVLPRELLWRSAALAGSALLQSYSNEHIVPQGSAYLYSHGMDGAPRDQALSVKALAFLSPRLARSSILAVMSATDATTGRTSYAWGGFGAVTDAVIHAAPSDLDIFILDAVTDYMLATGDPSLLGEVQAFWPRNTTDTPPGAGNSTSVLAHARAAFAHLQRGVGVGEHGCVALGDGDWNDGVLEQAAAGGVAGVLLTRLYGESVPNAAMAAVVLPKAATVLQRFDAALASDMLAFAASQRSCVSHTTSGGPRSWFARGWFKDAQNASYLHANDGGAATVPPPSSPPNQTYVDLEAQVWPLLDAAFPAPVEDAPSQPPMLNASTALSLLHTVQQQLSESSPIGPRLTTDGQVWPAISQLATVAAAALQPELAWRWLLQHSWAAHADAFPESWVGVWGGPDGYVSTEPPAGQQPGGTWSSAATPMTDFPVANSNPDAMFLWASLAALGVRASAAAAHAGNTVGGLSVDATRAEPLAASADELVYSLRTSVVALNASHRSGVNGTWTAPENGAGNMTVSVVVPSARRLAPAVTLGGRVCQLRCVAGAVRAALKQGTACASCAGVIVVGGVDERVVNVVLRGDAGEIVPFSVPWS